MQLSRPVAMTIPSNCGTSEPIGLFNSTVAAAVILAPSLPFPSIHAVTFSLQGPWTPQSRLVAHVDSRGPCLLGGTFLQIWDLREGHLLYTIEGHQGPVSHVRFSQEGDYFCSTDQAGVIMSWKSNFDKVLALPKDAKKGAAVTKSSAAAPVPTTLQPPSNLGNGPCSPPIRRLTRKKQFCRKYSHSHTARPASSYLTSLAEKKELEAALNTESEDPLHRGSATVSGIEVGERPSISPCATQYTQQFVPDTRAPRPHSEAGAPAASLSAVAPHDEFSRIPEALAQSLGQITAQLHLLNETVVAFDKRMTLQEDKLNRLIAQLSKASPYSQPASGG